MDSKLIHKISLLTAVLCANFNHISFYSVFFCTFQLYSEALEIEKTRDDIYSNRAQAYLKLERYKG